MLRFWKTSFILVAALACFGATPLFAQAPADPVNDLQAPVQAAASEPGTIVGTITDVNDTPVPGATVILEGSDHSEIRSVTTNENGFFEIHDVPPGNSYQIHIRAAGFTDWKSPVFTLEPGQHRIEDTPHLQIGELKTAVTVTPETTKEIAIEQVKAELKQRPLGGIFPDFFAVYTPNPAPLDARLRFKLALRLAADPSTVAGTAFLAGFWQAAYYPQYSQGFKGYAERFGASYTDDFADIMMTEAVLPSLLHQDPRYYFDGKGSVPSRVFHVLKRSVITTGDNGRWEPNYSLLGGDFAAAAVSNLYYPRANRGMGIVLKGFAINSVIHVAVRLLDEFVFHPRGSLDQSTSSTGSPCKNGGFSMCN